MSQAHVPRILPRLLINELSVMFDRRADMSTVPFAGSLEAFRCRHVGAAELHVGERRPLGSLVGTASCTQPSSLGDGLSESTGAMGCGHMGAPCLPPFLLLATTSPGTAESTDKH